MEAEQETNDRSIRAMLEHMLESEYFYVTTLGRLMISPEQVHLSRSGKVICWNG
jgi:hypothetical protein